MRIFHLLLLLCMPLLSFAQSDTCDVSIVLQAVSCPGLADGSLTVVTNSGGPYLYSWNGNLPTTNPTLPGLTAGGPYTVLVSDTNLATFCTAEFDTLMPNSGVYIFGGYCPGEIPTLNAGLFFGYQPLFYDWSTGDTTQQIMLPLEFTGEVTLNTTNAIGCDIEYTVDVFEREAPIGQVLLPDTVCEGIFVPLTTIDTDADSVVWRWEGDGVGYDFNNLASFAGSGYQYVTWQGYFIDGCPNIPMEDSVYVTGRIPADYTAEQIPCSKLVEFSLNSRSDSCALFIGDSLYMNICDGYVVWDAPEYAEYDFTLYSTQPNHCDDTMAIHLDVRTEPTLFLPNAFSPDDDLINEEWPDMVDIPKAGYELRIFDRWGNLLWVTNDTQMKWDGSYGGQPVPIGVYIYTMHHRDPCELTNEVSRRGHLTVVR